MPIGCGQFLPPRGIRWETVAGVIFDMACEDDIARATSWVERARDAKADHLVRAFFDQLQSTNLSASRTTGGAKDCMRRFGCGNALGFRKHPGNDADRFHIPKGTLPVFPFFRLRYRDNAQSGK